jgi:pimeloyl-ACP methyl ester carboxylesterase
MLRKATWPPKVGHRNRKILRGCGISPGDLRSTLLPVRSRYEEFDIPSPFGMTHVVAAEAIERERVQTLRVNADAANPLSDHELRSLQMPVLLLFGDGEVIYGSADALQRARRLIPDVEGDLIPDARILDF